jgi:hypothetical protein
MGTSKSFKDIVVIPIIALSLVFRTADTSAQQIPDTAFTFPIRQPAYMHEKGSIVFIDEVHNNFHTRDGGFLPFARLLEQDGYRVYGLKKSILSDEILANCKILVIANALNSINTDNWVLPTPSAFSQDEIEIITKWVKKGGSLFLIADHMPFAGAAYELGKAFGIEFLNGFAVTGERLWPPSIFLLENGTLKNSPVTNGLKEYEKIDKVATFTGSAFKADKSAMPVLCFLNENYSLQPDTAWRFNSLTPKQYLNGYYQGSIRTFGAGKVAVFGEAAMFTAQIANSNLKAGFNSESAPQNAQFALNLIHWLDGVKEYSGSEEKVKISNNKK